MKNLCNWLLALSVMALAFPASAEDNAAVATAPVQAERLKSGYSSNPVMQCTTQKKKYEDMLAQIETLEKSIKEGHDCEDEKAKVSSLASLLGTEREEFWALFQKGQEEALSEEEAEKLQTYIDNVVQKSASVIEIINAKSGFFQSGCFDEKKKESSLSLISNVLNEVSGAIGTISGPYGAAISLAGKITSGLFKSLDKALKSSGYYHFKDDKNRRDFAKNLCTYYSFKSDLIKHT